MPFLGFITRSENQHVHTNSKTLLTGKQSIIGNNFRDTYHQKSKVDNLIYFQENTIHAFDIEGKSITGNRPE